MNKYFVIFCLSLVACVSKNKESKANEVKYYTKLTGIISPYMDYNPRGEINPDSTGHSPHYKVIYNSEGKISEMQFYKYGRKSNDGYYGTHSVKYTYGHDSVIRSYFDSNANRALMGRHYYGGGPIHKEVFFLTPSGTKKELIFRDSLDNRISNGFGTYKYLWSEKTSARFIQEQFKEDGSRNLLTTYFPFHKSDITVDSKGHLYSIANLDTITNVPAFNDNAGYARVIFDFDQYGNEQGWSFHNLDGTLATRKSFAGMEYGYSKVTYYFNWKDRSKGLSSSFSMNFFGSNEEAIVSNDHIHSSFFEFDDYDNLTSIVYYGVLNEPRIHPLSGYHKINISYDTNGNQIEIIQFDTHNNKIGPAPNK